MMRALFVFIMPNLNLKPKTNKQMKKELTKKPNLCMNLKSDAKIEGFSSDSK